METSVRFTNIAILHVFYCTRTCSPEVSNVQQRAAALSIISLKMSNFLQKLMLWNWQCCNTAREDDNKKFRIIKNDELTLHVLSHFQLGKKIRFSCNILLSLKCKISAISLYNIVHFSDMINCYSVNINEMLTQES